MDIKERLEKITQRNLKVKHKRNSTWPFEKRIEAVTQYLVLGNMKQVSVLTGVSYEVLKDWKGSPWWSELEKEIRATENLQMDSKLSKIVDKSLDAVQDRVENGDFIYDQKNGEIRRKPVALRDVHRVAVDMLSKRELLRDGASGRKEVTQVSMDEQLKQLAHEMAKWFQQESKPVIELEEVEDVDHRMHDEPTDSSSLKEGTNRAVYEEREAGLQTGERSVQQPPGSSEETSGEERRPEGTDEAGSGAQG